MLFHLSDGKTLIAFHHNRHSDRDYTSLSGAKLAGMKDRSEIWFATSVDGGRIWSDPRFLLANALAEAFASPFRNYQCSYMDCILDNGTVHIFVPHRWQRVLHLTINESDLADALANKDLG